MGQIISPPPKFPYLSIAYITHVFVGLTFKADVPVCLFPATILDEPEQELQHVPKIEEHNQHFATLPVMDFLMVDVLLSHHGIASDDNPLEKRYRLVPLRREPTASYYLHTHFIINILAIARNDTESTKTTLFILLIFHKAS
jgi:hypothetical protein